MKTSYRALVLLAVSVIVSSGLRAQITVSNEPFTELLHDHYSDAGWLENGSFDYIDTGAAAGSKLLFPDISVSFSTASHFEVTFQAPEGFRFQITPSYGQDRLVELVATWGNNPAHTGSTPTSLTNRALTFEGLSSAAAITPLSNDYSFLTRDGQSLMVGFWIAVHEPVSFTSFTYSFDYDPLDLEPYAPLLFGGGYFGYQEFHYGSLAADPGPRMMLEATAIPEPSTYAAIAAAVALFAAAGRRVATRRARGFAEGARQSTGV